MNSALYLGRVTHRRIGGVEHTFGYRHALLALDLAELEQAFEGRWFWSVERPNLASFRRADYLGADSGETLENAVRARVRAELGREPRGHIVLLTQPRLLGFVFNPVSFYYVHDEAGALDSIVAEITNTPWNERHSYVLDARGGGASTSFAKNFHVSPFQPLEQRYHWTFGTLGPDLRVQMTNSEAGRAVFQVELTLQRHALDGASLAKALVLCPGFSLRSLAAIYWQALRLKLKGAPFFEHPRHRTTSPKVSTP